MPPRPRRTLHDVARHIASRQRMRTLVRELGAHLGVAAREPMNLMTRCCPVCDRDDVDAHPALRAPVYEFHLCRTCSLLYARRILRHEVTRRLYRERPIYREYWEMVRLDAEAMVGREVYGALVARLCAHVHARGAAIDVGCGFGKLVSELAPYFHEVVGLELNRRTAQVGRELFQVPIRTERIEALTRPNGSVDLMVMNQILEHLTELKSTLDAAHRLLRAGGVLYIGIPHGNSLGMKLRRASHPFLATHRHINLFSSSALERLATQAGFVPLRLGTSDGLDLSLTEKALERVTSASPLLWAPILLFDRAVRAIGQRTHLPSRLGMGSHLDAIFLKPRS